MKALLMTTALTYGTTGIAWRAVPAVVASILLGGALGAPAGPALDRAHPPAAYAGSAGCRECHGKFYTLWSTSFHGLAMQPFTAELAKTKLTPQTNDVVAGQFRFRAELQKGVIVERTPTNETRYPITQAMGGKNVFYFLTRLERGWLQVLPVAYDVRRQEWFDTTASAMRHFGDRRDEALYWKERPLTFNTSCFSCHVSQLSKNYDLGSDSYQTTWAEPGINCETCHGPAGEHARLFRDLPTNAPAPADLRLIAVSKLTVDQRNATCAPCHARMSPVTMNFAPGDRYFDHFDLTAFENADFYPDGRDLGENYTYTQWRLSPCAKGGKLDCLHCHTSSGRYRFTDPAQANDACLPCHAERVKNSPAHTRHAAGTPANQCVSCHMPRTEFARMRRTDHSMRPPTPATTLAYQSPNACNLCHTNQDAAWSDKYVREWHPHNYQQPVLQRAALIAAARKGDWKRLPDILAYLASPAREEIQTVSLVRLLANCPADDQWPVLRKLADDGSPLVRASVAEVLGERLDRANTEVLLKAVGDDYRLVRVRAAAGLAAVPEEQLPEGQRARVHNAIVELIGSMRSRPDDMASHYNLGNLHLARGQMLEATTEFQTAIRLQPEAVQPYVNAALAYNALGQNNQAEASLRHALRLEPTNAPAQLNLAMLLAEMGRTAEAEQFFRAAFKARPQSAQAAYNLGILLSKEHPAEALDWCRRAANLAPDSPQYGYTYAFYLHQAGQGRAALEVLRRVRQGHPEHEDSAALEQLLRRQQSSAGK